MDLVTYAHHNLHGAAVHHPHRIDHALIYFWKMAPSHREALIISLTSMVELVTMIEPQSTTLVGVYLHCMGKPPLRYRHPALMY
jgi:hypothetical protein